MAEAVYQERETGLFEPSEWAGGPWSRDSQHGGPVNALLARGVEAAARETGFHPARITVDLLGPVPMRPLALRWSYARRGRRMALVEAALLDGEAPVARASSVLFVPSPELHSSFEEPEQRPPPPESLEATPLMHRDYRDLAPPGFHWSLEVRMVEDTAGDDAAAWISTPLELVAGQAMTPLERSAAVSDLTYGLTTRTRMRQRKVDVEARRFMMINTDTNLYYERPPEGEWFCFRHVHVADQRGIGLAEVIQYDQRGRYGRSLQVLLANSR